MIASRSQKAWSKEQIETLFRMRKAGRSWAEISPFVDHKPDACSRRFYALRKPPPARKNHMRTVRIGPERHQAGPNVSSLNEKLFADARARAVARELRTITQEFFGDPPPGYSARDQIRNLASGDMER